MTPWRRSLSFDLGGLLLLILVSSAAAAQERKAPVDLSVTRSQGCLLRVELGFAQPLIEHRLGDGATNIVRMLRIGIRKTAKTVIAAVGYWRDWLPRLTFYAAICLLTPLVDSSLIRAWRSKGIRGVLTAALLTLVVYVRLLMDRRAPLVGKLMLIFAITYGVAVRDLVPDWSLPAGLLEDVFLQVLASRSFLRLCPRKLIEFHAVQASRRVDSSTATAKAPV